jgi:hypothetical protein
MAFGWLRCLFVFGRRAKWKYVKLNFFKSQQNQLTQAKVYVGEKDLGLGREMHSCTSGFSHILSAPFG